MAVKIGIGLFTGQVPPDSARSFGQEYREVLDMVRLAETVGFDSAWVSEHHGAGDGYLPSLLVMLGAFAAVTDRIELGTGVVLTPFHDPLRLAEDAAVVDQLSNGRLILGLGLGWREEEFRMFGQETSERVRRTVDTVEILRRAWTGERFSYDGKAYRYDEVMVTPTPARPGGPPIYLGAVQEVAVRRAGRLGDGYIRSRSGFEAAKQALAVAEAGARDAGKDPSTLGFAMLQNVFVWDEGDAWQMVEPFVGNQLGVFSGWAEGADTPGKGFWYSPPDEETMRKLTLTGSPREVAAALRPMVEEFADRQDFHLVVRLHYPGMDFDVASRAIELFAEEAIPALKGA